MLSFLMRLWILVFVFLALLNLPWFRPPVDPAVPTPSIPPIDFDYPVVWPPRHAAEPAVQPTARPLVDVGFSAVPRPTIAVPSGVLSFADASGAVGPASTGDRIVNPSGLPRSTTGQVRSTFRSGARNSNYIPEDEQAAQAGGGISPVALGLLGLGACGGGAALLRRFTRR